MSVIRRTAGVLVALLLPVVASAKPAVKSDVTAVGFTEWTGVEVSSHPLCFGRGAVYLNVEEGKGARLFASAEGLQPAQMSF